VIYRALGRTGLSVSVIGLGCGHLGPQGRARTRADLVRLLHHAVDRGITFFDTADVYMAGESERLLGEVLSPIRDGVVIATKVGFRSMLPASVIAGVRRYRSWAARRGGVAGRVAARARTVFTRTDYSATYVRPAVEASLRRLRTDRIDLLQLHSPSALALYRDGALETLERLTQEGKIRFYGLAFATLTQAQHAFRIGGFSTVQVPISAGAPAAEILAWAQQRAIGVIANQPLRKGALIRGDVTPQAALRFVTSLPGVSTVVVGTTSLRHLDENVAALDTPAPTAAQLRCLSGDDAP
jgi:aryl-alcohol dehydrogenase-like predicted oxidoreductase